MRYRTALLKSLDPVNFDIPWHFYRRQVWQCLIAEVVGFLNIAVAFLAGIWNAMSLIFTAIGIGFIYLSLHIEARVRQHEVTVHRCTSECP